ncbi:MAG: hypothetical protein AVDCRST_MAG14-462 [uncultured Rubrobacteraceae bacterium]|uniref:Uncharacterized protein n=1 Tax=uncultured Rubrobacteraceae bacterium TaxID=349277 RepID=A0A6J4QQK1_9ACTN|nr:MAG: hypothetical protein AVDCRST_MAG14-462 [uncultured Rubrobacteraceae bacterium]
MSEATRNRGREAMEESPTSSAEVSTTLPGPTFDAAEYLTSEG